MKFVQKKYHHQFKELVGGKAWKERVYNREEWKRLLRTAMNRCSLHMPME
jgi:hypothetical protein